MSKPKIPHTQHTPHKNPKPPQHVNSVLVYGQGGSQAQRKPKSPPFEEAAFPSFPSLKNAIVLFFLRSIYSVVIDDKSSVRRIYSLSVAFFLWIEINLDRNEPPRRSSRSFLLCIGRPSREIQTGSPTCSFTMHKHFPNTVLCKPCQAFCIGSEG